MTKHKSQYYSPLNKKGGFPGKDKKTEEPFYKK